eukprot:GFUD01033600.1.p1 GENE.GFUD01033600.1~~GFUD01033600.1.p1  ORF type:complete len:524 (+),score=80.30 GFUD01033600.1:304-1875(+)
MEYMRRELFPCSVPLCTQVSTSKVESEKHFIKNHRVIKTEVWSEVVDSEFNFENLAESDENQTISTKSQEPIFGFKFSEKVTIPNSKRKGLSLKCRQKTGKSKSSGSNDPKLNSNLQHEWLVRSYSNFTIQKIENLTKIKLTEEAKIDFDNLIQEGKDQEIYCKLFGNIFATLDQSFTARCRNWICNKCPNGKFLGSKKEFEDHFKSLNHGIIAYTCELCSKSLKSLEILKAHLKQKHFIDAKCEICLEVCSTKNTLQTHKLKVHNEGGYQCDSCIKMCSTMLLLKAHVRDQHGDKSFPCSTCGKVFKNKANCAGHELIHTGKEFECEFCILKFKSEIGFNRHVKLEHTKNFEVLNCHECGATFKVKTKFNTHIKFHQKHPDLICDVCDKLFHSRTAKVLHKETVHLKNRRFACDQCEFRTVSNGKLKKHIQKVHENQHEMCFLCNQSVKHAYHHVKTAHKDQPTAWQEFMERKREVLTKLKSKTVEEDIKPFKEVLETIQREQKVEDDEDEECLPSDQDIVG